MNAYTRIDRHGSVLTFVTVPVSVIVPFSGTYDGESDSISTCNGSVVAAAEAPLCAVAGAPSRLPASVAATATRAGNSEGRRGTRRLYPGDLGRPGRAGGAVP